MKVETDTYKKVKALRRLAYKAESNGQFRRASRLWRKVYELTYCTAK